MIEKIRKYPRTPHLSGSRLQHGDEDLSQIPFSRIKGRSLVIEEKVDGANAAISFGTEGELLLQSRGHYLVGGYRERHYELLKSWAAERREELFGILGTRYIMYGEWLYAKHKIYYDALPHFFMEFDILDRETGTFLDTERRHALLSGSSVVSVPVLGRGKFGSVGEILSLLTRSLYITERHTEHLLEEVDRLGLEADAVLRETDPSDLAEGLYIKVEEDGAVTDRMKYVRYSFTQGSEAEGKRWLAKPIIPNKLQEKENGLS